MKIVDGELVLEVGESVAIPLRDVDANRTKMALARITRNPLGMGISVEGYGEHSAKTDSTYNQVVVLEKENDKLRVICWADINQEDPTTIIDMEDAREMKRKYDGG